MKIAICGSIKMQRGPEYETRCIITPIETTEL